MMNDDIEKGRPGQFFEDFLKEQGHYEETNNRTSCKTCPGLATF